MSRARKRGPVLPMAAARDLIATPAKDSRRLESADRFVQNHQILLLLGCRLATEGSDAVVWSGGTNLRRR
jgi:hypothetical protein